ncbi:prolyl oligopeptidase family serine peptidase [Flaviramulus sp. BrNp1-15]|uniref:prolyl oligopeptidase family serine peptidase n=1 Tax=Flaviramulus sp. BrNp1-15 TaxID=2916754 RepID=UPI001EE7CE56|nr:prolyl oligopeptidase family serine peptidase [Flaviramulus sp. BrNp1-15]ULC59122.1 prolyl oligopeptidase family serine peptidase [Flaviramulus sp. BrNp1-15]
MKRIFCALTFFISLVSISQVAVKPEILPQKIVTNTYHGITLEDPYQYLENLDDPMVVAWMKDNANYASFVLNNISGKKELFDNMKELIERRSASISSVNITDDDTYYYLKRIPGEEISKMYKRNGYEGEETLFFDPTKYKAEEGKIYTISSITPNLKGDKIAVSVSPNGSENPELLLFKSNGEQYKEILQLAEGVSWHLSGDSFFYFRLNSADLKDVNRQIFTSNYVHKVGTDQSSDKKYFSKENYESLSMMESELPFVIYSKEANKNILFAGSVDKNAKVYINDSNGSNKSWRPILSRDNKVTDISLNSKHVYYLTYDDAPNFKIVKTSIDKPEFSNSITVIEESDTEIITSFSLTKDGLYYATVENGVEAKVYFLADGESNAEELQLPFTAGSAYISAKGSEFSDVWITIAGWTSPNKRFLYNPITKTFTHKPLSTPVEYPELNNLIAKEVMVESHDGVMVPVSIIHNKDIELNGQNPAVLYSYGAYGISTSPFFSPIVLAYTMYNGVLVVPHIRGGGELGDAWHKAGQKLNKPNTWKDAIATAEYLIENGYSNPKKISIFGGSAGGILVGRAITERPDLFVAAAPMVGAMNTVRGETTPNGPINAPEFGTVKDPEEFKGLLAMDSYHSLIPGTDYPATLITAGMNDPRVIAWQPSKFAAKMQHDNKGDSPILFYTNFEGGHGGRTTLTQTIDEFSNIFSFFYWQSGHPDFKLIKPILKD